MLSIWKRQIDLSITFTHTADRVSRLSRDLVELHRTTVETGNSAHAAADRQVRGRQDWQTFHGLTEGSSRIDRHHIFPVGAKT